NVSWAVTDVHGNTATATQQVVVNDTELPTIIVSNQTANNTPGSCGATVVLNAPAVNDNCGVASVTNDHPSTTFPVGTTNVSWTVTDVHGLSKTVVQQVTVVDNEKPVITTAANQSFCNTGSGNYTVPAISASDNCGVASISFAISGATVRSGTGTNASGVFATGVSTIVWTVTDLSGNSRTGSTTVTVSSLPAVTITASSADAFCNKLTLTASGGSGTTYQWFAGSTLFANTQQIELGAANGDGVYTVYATSGGCTSAAASYNFQKQNLSSSYTILTFKDTKIGKYNKVNSGSVGVMSNGSEAEFKSGSSVTGSGSFVKAPRIDRIGSNITINQSIIGVASVTLPTMQFNTASTKNLPSANASVQNATINGNYNNLTVKKGVSVTVTGNTFGTVKLEEGASIKFTSAVLNIETLSADKGAKNGNNSYIRFAGATSIRVSNKVSLGSQVWVNPDNNQVTFYMGDLKSDEEKFTVTGGNTRVTANIYMPDGKLKVISTDADNDDHPNCNHQAHTAGNCPHRGHDHNDCDHHAHSAGDCDDDVYMTGLFIAESLESRGNTVIWNSFACGTPPAVLTGTKASSTQSVTGESVKTETSETDLKVTVMPNPSNTFFTLKFESRFETPLHLRVMDASGRVVDARSKIGANSTLQIGAGYSSGKYYAEVVQGGIRKTVQLIKGRG
ncbi:MAG: HYR domain-containing protein, partial [Chitinophagaceae bacterium]|nr:HYR domain-containing protein [Chitinophagaceae bacterium]